MALNDQRNMYVCEPSSHFFLWFTFLPSSHRANQRVMIHDKSANINFFRQGFLSRLSKNFQPKN
jgi:hypothetical protein